MTTEKGVSKQKERGRPGVVRWWEELHRDISETFTIKHCVIPWCACADIVKNCLVSVVSFVLSVFYEFAWGLSHRSQLLNSHMCILHRTQRSLQIERLFN